MNRKHFSPPCRRKPFERKRKKKKRKKKKKKGKRQTNKKKEKGETEEEEEEGEEEETTEEEEDPPGILPDPPRSSGLSLNQSRTHPGHVGPPAKLPYQTPQTFQRLFELPYVHIGDCPKQTGNLRGASAK